MKKTLLLFVLAALAVTTASAQVAPLRKNYVNFSVGAQELYMPWYTYTSDDRIGTATVGALTLGHSYILHRKPIAGMLHIGLDATWVDLNYAWGVNNYDYKIHQFDIAMGIGPSVHLTPVSKLGVHTYFRYNPSIATYFDDDVVGGGYASMFVTGLAASWSVVSLGTELRWGGGNYHDWTADGGSKSQIDTFGVRVYFGLRY